MLDQITVLILTWNEAPNIARTLAKLTWARRILIVDSGSTDETLALAKGFPQVQVLHRAFDTFAGQCNYGLQHIDTPWVLSLDADYVLSDRFSAELSRLAPEPNVSGYSARFTYCIAGHPLRGSLYPPRTVLYRHGLARYEDDGHGHRVRFEGPVEELNARIFHDDRKPLSHWLTAQQKYAAAEAAKLVAVPASALGRADRIRKKIILAPALVLIYTLFARGLILDGWPGWFYAFQRACAELLLSLHLLERRVRPKTREG